MEYKAQSALEYLMTYGWALVVIAIMISALIFLLGQSGSSLTCIMSPSAGAIGYVDHSVASDGNLTIKLRNDSGHTITNVNLSFTGDFSSAAAQTNICSGCVSSKEFLSNPASTGIASGSTYTGTVKVDYNRSGILHSAVASCTGSSR
jgi:hypothetical protein